MFTEEALAKVSCAIYPIAYVADSRCAYAKIKRSVEHSARACPVREGTTLLFSSRRTFLQSLSRSALVLTLENVLALAASATRRALFGHTWQTTSSVPSGPAASNLGVSFVNVA